MLDKVFAEALRRTYVENPCQVLPNSLWKVTSELDHFQTAFESGEDGVNRLEAWNDDTLYLYWLRENRQPSKLLRIRLSYVQMALMHQDFLEPDVVAGFSVRQLYFRLRYNGGPVVPPELPRNIRLAEMKLPVDAEAAANLIAHSAGENHPSAEEVAGWAARPVFAPDLCLWAIDMQSNMPVGLGIAEYDPTTPEIWLEWVEALPLYAASGLREQLVRELLRRAQGRAPLITAGGPVEDRDNPGGFYRNCGFTGSDIWWLLAR
jgi:GNAT superfamily N-acetyltransferase